MLDILVLQGLGRGPMAMPSGWHARTVSPIGATAMSDAPRAAMGAEIMRTKLKRIRQLAV